ncbi:MAG: MerR family DNA-binding transcriptional regulator [Oscillospiraceae bacterium]|jgi:DNA-binding transcriptional MerR regulator/effector-binding domain-containing protein|nr:MerR family DNA-binding transcriptional regulator [Oscillospiraceae bacterium]
MNESTLLSIKEFSKFTGVAQSTLRYYDEIGLLPPFRRGENNYRYYVPVQIITLKFINVLTELGVPLSTVKDMSLRRTPEKVMDLLNRQEAKLNRRLDELRTAFSIIHTLRGNIRDGLSADGLLDGDLLVKTQELEETRYILGPETPAGFKTAPAFYEEFVNFCNSAEENRINIRYPIGGYYKDFGSLLKSPGRPDRFISYDPLGNSTNPAGKYLVGYNRGYYGEFGDLPQKMSDYATERGLELKGPVCVVYLLDEISTENPERFLMRTTVRAKKRRRNNDCI